MGRIMAGLTYDDAIIEKICATELDMQDVVEPGLLRQTDGQLGLSGQDRKWAFHSWHTCYAAEPVLVAVCRA